MICQSCGKKDSTVHFTKIVNGEIEEVHLCESCFNTEKGFGISLPFSVENIFSGLFGGGLNKEENTKVCPNCDWSYAKVLSSGKLGCPTCYEFFNKEMGSMLKGIQGHNKHVGKIPSNTSERLKRRKELSRLDEKLRLSISEERYEDAARYRDEIKSLKENIARLEMEEEEEDKDD